MRSTLKIFSFLPKEGAVRLSDGKRIQSSFAIAGNFCLNWKKDTNNNSNPSQSISALISALRPLPEMIVVGSNAKVTCDFPCPIEQSDPVN